MRGPISGSVPRYKDMTALLWLALGAAAACALLAIASPTAQAGWTPPLEISQPGVFTSGVQVAADAAGDATAAWVNGNSSGAIKSSYQPAGGGWGAPLTPIPTSNCASPSLAVNSAGAAVLVADCGSGAEKMRVAYRPAGGTWSATELPESENGSTPHAAIDNSGNAIVVWERSDSTVRSSYKTAAGSWEAAQLVSPTGEVVTEPQMAMSPAGLAVAVWRHEVSATVFTVATRGRSSGSASTWAGTKVLSPTTAGSDAGAPQVRVNAGGRAAVWVQKVSAERWILRSAWGSSTSWGEDAAAHEVNDPTTSVEIPQVAIDGQGLAVAVWRSTKVPLLTGFGGVQSATTPFVNGPWSAPGLLFGDAPPEGLHVFGPPPRVAADTAGNATAVWAGQNSTLYAALRPAGAGFAAAVPISGGLGAEELQGAQVAMDPAGDTFAAWTTGSAEHRVAVAMRDGTPPVLSGIVVPVAGKAGAAATMSATATDTWSSPVAIHWDFGDGSTAIGSSVSHTYASGGTKTVSVFATDAAGNASSGQTRQIVVTQEPTLIVDPAPRRVTLGVSLPKQSWGAIAKARAVKLLCSLNAVGTCEAKAEVTGAVAKRLGLTHGKARKPVLVGSGSVQIVTANKATKLTLKLTAKALTAIEKAKQSVPLILMVTGSASERLPATLNKNLTIKRP
jgi:hypothetical protein